MSEDIKTTNGHLTSVYKKMMEYTGFYRDGKPTIGIIETVNLRQNNADSLEKRIKYSSVIDPTKLNATAIFELSGSPCIYFTSLAQANPDPAEIAQLRKIAWNQGLAPMLWIVTPTKVLLYNCYARPSPDNETDARKHLIDIFEQTESGLQQLNDFAGRLQIESGRFWEHEKARQIDRRQRVDESLLADLEEVESLLVKAGLKTTVAHALLGRSIFVAYLQGRGILGTKFFQERFSVENFVELLSSSFAKSATYEIFEWVRKTFNGDLFPLEHKDENGHIIHERDLVDDDLHLAKVGNFLSGVEMKTGQRRLWPYKFDVIPIELISSIYEKFIHSSNSLLARERSTYYTPINLVDLVLSEVFKQLPANANILDMSCGSGVFLVESLRRLVACRVANGEEWSRELVRDTLYNQIYGVDISKEAIQIAAFSLYLTALELDPDLQSLDKIKFHSLREKNLFDADAFDTHASFNEKEPFAAKNFQAIVGNPPWRRKTTNYLAEDYCRKRNYPLTRRSLDQAFMWRIADLARDKTVIGLILHSRPLFGHMPDSLEARKKLLTRFNPRVIVNLSALRQEGLFPKSDAPATILIAEGRNSERNNTFFLACAEYTESFKRHGIIEIGPESIKKVSVQHVLSDSDALKIASWGSARDLALISRLRALYPPLRDLVKDPKLVKKRTEEWLGGQGFQEAGGSKEAPALVGKKWLPSGVMQPYLLDPDELKEILPERRYHRPRDVRIYEAPLVITTRGLNADGFFSAFSPDDVVYTEEYYGISFPRKQEYLAQYLNGVLNSYLASYFLFLTASVWGVERDKVEPNDL
ncbi:MAG TPA: N-6 DNA methylase, partial [Ktedonobacteraceae bacterium]|nr:N-6 DNA methylase [Ktedonobacteraceae bacterium]